MKAAAGYLHGWLEIPADGNSRPFGASLIEFRDDVLVPFVFEGKIYLARIGHTGLRSLMTSDYLFNAYQLSGDRLEVVAAFYVSKVRGRLLSATVE